MLSVPKYSSRSEYSPDTAEDIVIVSPAERPTNPVKSWLAMQTELMDINPNTQAPSINPEPNPNMATQTNINNSINMNSMTSMNNTVDMNCSTNNSVNMNSLCNSTNMNQMSNSMMNMTNNVNMATNMPANEGGTCVTTYPYTIHASSFAPVPIDQSQPIRIAYVLYKFINGYAVQSFDLPFITFP